MFQALRNARAVQLVLLLASVLAVSGAFGLHPEPEGSATRVALRYGWNALDDSVASESHDCYLCLSHRSVSLPRLSAVVLEAGSVIGAKTAAASSPLGRLESHPREGRAPPALS
jgi:hypothetical protein